MTHPAVLPPSEGLWSSPFAQESMAGLFAAPWTGTRSPEEQAALEKLARRIQQTSSDHDELAAVFAHLLQVRIYCLAAAQCREEAAIRGRYREALAHCETVLALFHHRTEGTAGDLALWTQGVHALIRAQLALPDSLAEGRRLSKQALPYLRAVRDPLCAGAEADAAAAMTLALEPQALADRLACLPVRIREEAARIRTRIPLWEHQLNQRLEGVRSSHQTALAATLLWGLLNLVLMAALPVNGYVRRDLPWSVPFAVAVPILWWWTWDRPFREGAALFTWVGLLRLNSLTAFQKAVESTPDPAAALRRIAADSVARGQDDQQRLQAFRLFRPPVGPEPLEAAEEALCAAEAALRGEWMLETVESNPWPLAEALPVEPSLLPRAVRVWYRQTAA